MVESTTVESSSRVSPTAARCKRRVEVLKQRMGAFGESLQGTRGSRRCRHMGMEGPCPRARMRSEEVTRRIILAPTTGRRFKEGDPRALFDDEEFRLILFNFWEAGLIPKVEPM
jgi:hypothetical protein